MNKPKLHDTQNPKIKIEEKFVGLGRGTYTVLIDSLAMIHGWDRSAARFLAGPFETLEQAKQGAIIPIQKIVL